MEISSDGGPEFVAQETKDFFLRWGICHRLSSVSLPSSNGRAELAVKSTKRLLMDNVSPNGELDDDKMVRALLTQRNTPDPGCRMSPAQILFGRPLRDSLPYLEKDIMAFKNPRVNEKWRKAWELKEEALRTRYVKTLENLSEHSRMLPPLRHGDQVLIQNQTGRFPKKWDRSGIIVEVKENDQYVVKVTGSGRLTLRNRRFLRKFNHKLSRSLPYSPQQPLQSNTIPSPEIKEVPKGLNGSKPIPATPKVSHLDKRETVESGQQNNPPLSQPPLLPPIGPEGGRDEMTGPDIQPIARQDPFGQDDNVPAVPEESEKRRSTRERKQRTVYDASSGTYVEPRS